MALHHQDVPWRPSDLIQRNGRILRQGNENKEVSVFNYITENTFDAYLWQILEQKQRYISQIMTGRSALRSCEDMDNTMLQYAEFKALAVSDPRIKEKMETDNEISRLTVLKSAWQSQQNDLQLKIKKHYPSTIANIERRIAGMETDLVTYLENKPDDFSMTVDGRMYDERTKAAEHFKVRSRKLGRNIGDILEMGSYSGFQIRLNRRIGDLVSIQLCGKFIHSTDLGESELGNITRIENLAERIDSQLENARTELDDTKHQLEAAKIEIEKPFLNEERLAELQRNKVELDLALEFKDSPDSVLEPEADRFNILNYEPEDEDAPAYPERLTMEQ